jgi:hypothetical protein
MAGEPIREGVVLVRDGTIRASALLPRIRIPEDYKVNFGQRGHAGS